MKLPIQAQPVTRKDNMARIRSQIEGISAQEISNWLCYYQGRFINFAHIGWGHTPEDAKYACNKWFSECNNQCEVVKEEFTGGLPPALPFPGPRPWS